MKVGILISFFGNVFTVFKSNERSEFCYIGLAGFCLFFFCQNLFTLNFDFSRFEL